jgi:molybdopterin converting factor small subunit
MNVKVLFFGATADVVGKRQIDVQYDGPTAVADVLENLSADHPSLHGHTLLSAVNQEYVDNHYLLKDGDELAVFTAVSGG